MLLVQRGQWLKVHLSYEIHGGLSIMQFYSLAEETVDGSVNVTLTLLQRLKNK